MEVEVSFFYRGERRYLTEHPTLGMGDGKTYGCVMIPGPCGRTLGVIFSLGEGWEHVSVSLEDKRKIPNWREMCFAKDLFWDKEDCAIQYHPPQSVYVDCCPNCLHLWKPIGQEIPMPDPILVGPR